MGRELQRAFLWMIFLLGLFMLWDAWQVRNGNPSFFGTPAPVEEQVATNNAGTQTPAAKSKDLIRSLLMPWLVISLMIKRITANSRLKKTERMGNCRQKTITI